MSVQAKQQQEQVTKEEDKKESSYDKYNGSKLRDDIAHMIASPEVLKQKITEGHKMHAERQKEKAKLKAATAPPAPIVTRRVGYKKLVITIPEDMAQLILNYAGHSASKQATIQVWYADNKEPQLDKDKRTVLPVFPLSKLEDK
jgi:hypothetical protein